MTIIYDILDAVPDIGDKFARELTIARMAFEAGQKHAAPPQAAPVAQLSEQTITSTAPAHIYLDLGEGCNPAEPGVRFIDLAEVTWSEDNASGNGIKYVRAAAPTTPKEAS